MFKKLPFITIAIIVLPMILIGQQNYFYGNIKIPLGDYIKFIIDNNTDEDIKTDGLIIGFGYGFRLKNNFWLESGLEAFSYNPIQKKYFTDKSSNYKEISGKNSGVFFQLNPFYRVDFEETDYLRIGCSVNGGIYYSSAKYYKNNLTNGQLNIVEVSSSNSKSSFLVNFAPFIGTVFFVNDRLAFGFDLQYYNVDWNKSMQKLNLVATLNIPSQRTNNIFLSGRVIFK